MKIAQVNAVALSYRYDPLPKPLATGQSYKRDTVIVRVETTDGIVGYGEAYHGKAPTVIAELVNTSLAGLVVGQDVDDTEGIWARVFARQMRGSGTGAAAMAGLSGIDMALWDARGKRLEVPVYRLLGGRRRTFRAYAGGVYLGFEDPDHLVAEVLRARDEHGYTAVKLRLGDTIERDTERLAAVREAVGGSFDLMVDINLGYDYAQMLRLLPVLDKYGVAWVEEPFVRTNIAHFADLRAICPVPLATGEHLFGTQEFLPLLQARGADIIQPDASNGGGVSELKKVGDLATLFHVRFAPHISNTRLNHAATLHVMSAVASSHIYEADATDNRYAHALCTADIHLGDGMVAAPDLPGLGVEVDESLFGDFPVIPGSPHLQDAP